MSAPSSDHIAYFRVSTKKQGESGLGLEAQRSYINHFYPNNSFLTEYTEVASGKNLSERPQLQQAIAHCLQTGATLVVAKIDRLSRKTEDALAIYSQLNGRLQSCDIPGLDKFTLTLFMAIADRERELISLRTKQALQSKKNQGHKLGSPKPLGPEVAAKGVAAIKQKAANNPNNRRASGYAQTLRNSGWSWSAIARRLNTEGFLTARGKNFRAQQVKRLVVKA